MKKFAFLIFVAFALIASAQKNAPKKNKSAKNKKEIASASITFKDPRDKKKYKIVELGGRVWMAEDLSSKQSACPAGWRLPSKSAWEDLAKTGWNAKGKWLATANDGADTITYAVGKSGAANPAIRCIQNLPPKPSENKNDIKFYSTVQIGTHLWMAENLNFKTGNSWCFENDDYHCNTYGRIYDWNTAINACPQGWHLPTRREWSEAEATEFAPKLDRSYLGNWWSITDYGDIEAYSWHIKENENKFTEKITNKSSGYSVRCVKNIPKVAKTNNIKQYKTIKMGHNVWMAENMDYKTGKSWCFEEDDYYCKKYGRLYDWNTASKICPPGWHLPSDGEWNDLEKSAGKNIASAIAAVKGGWRDSGPNEYTLDQKRSGEKISRWRNLEENGNWWTSTFLQATGSVRTRHLSATGEFTGNLNEKAHGLSVRCVQNPPTKKISRTFADSRDHKHYKVILMDKTIWMAENLNYNAKGSLCYDNKPENCAQYGRLYDWDLAQTVCPSPWRLASIEDWNNLIESIGDTAHAGEKLKSEQHWDGTDNYGFSAVPGGFTKAQAFNEKEERGYWWTSDNLGSNGKYKFMVTHRDSVGQSQYIKSVGLSVRCVQDCGLFNCVMEQ